MGREYFFFIFYSQGKCILTIRMRTDIPPIPNGKNRLEFLTRTSTVIVIKAVVSSNMFVLRKIEAATKAIYI